MLDVGCATGATYRFIKLIGAADVTSYTGIDISKTAIDRAKHVHPDGHFEHVELTDVENALRTQRDLVVSRDTIMHQERPYPFLHALLGCARNALIVRLRTRDKGDTVLDVERSCQAHYDAFWMPYIVLNTDDLLSEIASNARVTRIRINRSYQVLGGKNGRYLPK